MEKKKAIMRIENFSYKDGTLLLSVGDYGVRAMLKGLVELCEQRHGGYIKLELGYPYKQRTIPENNLYWVRCTEFGNFCGMTKDEVSYGVKVRAMEMGLWRGKDVPFSKNGEKIPDSSATADTQEFNQLLSVLDLIAAEYGYEWKDI